MARPRESSGAPRSPSAAHRTTGPRRPRRSAPTGRGAARAPRSPRDHRLGQRHAGRVVRAVHVDRRGARRDRALQRGDRIESGLAEPVKNGTSTGAPAAGRVAPRTNGQNGASESTRRPARAAPCTPRRCRRSRPHHLHAVALERHAAAALDLADDRVEQLGLALHRGVVVQARAVAARAAPRRARPAADRGTCRPRGADRPCARASGTFARAGRRRGPTDLRRSGHGAENAASRRCTTRE